MARLIIGANFVHYRFRNYPNDEIVVLDALTYAGNLSSLRSMVVSFWVMALTLVGVLAFRHMEQRQVLGAMSTLVVAVMLLPDALLSKSISCKSVFLWCRRWPRQHACGH